MTKKEFIKVAVKNLQHLSSPPFNSNVEHFLKTGIINGSFLVAIGNIYHELEKSKEETVKEK